MGGSWYPVLRRQAQCAQESESLQGEAVAAAHQGTEAPAYRRRRGQREWPQQFHGLYARPGYRTGEPQPGDADAAVRFRQLGDANAAVRWECVRPSRAALTGFLLPVALPSYAKCKGKRPHMWRLVVPSLYTYRSAVGLRVVRLPHPYQSDTALLKKK